MNPDECSYNGILIPEKWPPKLSHHPEKPMPVPYLELPPECIPIDVGRQLFVDDFLIETTTMIRQFHQPEKSLSNPILFPETTLEMDNGECPTACPFNDGVWYDSSDKLFKIWYHAGWFNSTAYAFSENGIDWHRPKLDVVPGTNSILPQRSGYRRDGACVWLDKEANTAEQRFKMFQYFRSPDYKPFEGGEIYTSSDGIHWGNPTKTSLLGDNSSFFYNPFRKKWVFSIRKTSLGVRARFYREHSDFNKCFQWNEDDPQLWAWSDELDLPDPEIQETPELYDVNAVAYESIMIGLISIFRGPNNELAAKTGTPKHNDLLLAYSRDGFHWDRHNRQPFIPSTKTPNTWDRAYIHASGGVCLIVEDKLYFYYGAFSGKSPKLQGNMVGSHEDSNAMHAGGSTGLAILRRDGFASMNANKNIESLTTRPVMFKGSHLFINANTQHGEMKVEILNENNTPIKSYTAEDCVPVSIDTTSQCIRWKNTDNLLPLIGSRIKFKFYVENGSLYSFWISKNKNGKSSGYVGAGGPDFTNSMDI